MKSRLRAAVLACSIIGLLVPAGAAAEAVYLDDARQAELECRYELAGGPNAHEAFEDLYGPNEAGRTAFEQCLAVRTFTNGRQRVLSERQGVLRCAPEFPEQAGAEYERCVEWWTRYWKRQLDDADQDEIRRLHAAANDCARERDELGLELFDQTYEPPEGVLWTPFLTCVRTKAYPPVP